MRHVLFVIGAIVISVAGCDNRANTRTITVKGSDTMVILGQRWAETYMQKSQGVTVQVTGGGSGTGIAALINGATDICQSSRPMSAKEKDQLKAKHQKEAKETPVALDGVAIYVNSACPLKKITQMQLKGIYTGKITNWKEIGGEDAKIVVYSRENSSGTYVFFKEHVLAKEDFAADVQTLPGTAAIINAVSKDPKSIGYGGIAYGAGVVPLPVSKDDAGDAVAPTMANVHSGTYPLSRPLFFYTIGEPAPEVKTFIDWVLSNEGQTVCEQVGYFPLAKK